MTNECEIFGGGGLGKPLTDRLHKTRKGAV